jgi:surface antigen
MSYQMDSLFGKADDREVTGSIKKPGDAMAAAELPPETDLAFTRAAVADVLSRAQKDSSVPWENPGSGARGTVTALAPTYSIGGAECRDFLASYVQGSKESWLRGEACREGQGKGKWEVRAFKPWIRS